MKKIIIAAILGLTSALYSADVVVYPRSTGYPYPCPIPKTGQKVSYAAGDDGWHGTNIGVAWPATRFTVLANTNCVKDNLTGLVWARNANLFGQTNWDVAITICNDLNYGDQTDWRLPSYQELNSLIDISVFNPPIIINHPFASVQYDRYWTSSTRAAGTGSAIYISYSEGFVSTYATKTNSFYYIWPVRGP